MKFDVKINSNRWLSLENLPDERWEDVIGFEGLYSVSNYGRIKSLRRSVEQGNGRIRTYQDRIMRLYVSKSGYVLVNFEHFGVTKKKGVHRVVAEAFIDNPHCFSQVNHIDEDKTNNRVKNLEWCTSKYNVNYGHRKEKYRKTALNNPKNSTPVLQYSFNGELIAEYPSIMETRRLFGSHVGEVCSHQCMSVFGYYWIYKGDNFADWLAIHKKLFSKHKRWKAKRVI